MKDSLKNYYGNIYTEDDRLFKDNKHKTEFILTTDYIDKYLKKGMRILELGTATGAYSLLYAKKGYQVDALEPYEPSLEILKSKVTKDMNINPVLGDARDLSMYEDDTFDMVLCLGPMYHLDAKGREECLQESIRVTKPKGLIYLACVSNNSCFVKCIKKFDNYIEEYKEEIKEGFKIVDMREIFHMVFPEEIEQLCNKYNLEKLHYLTTDGISFFIDERINNFSEHEFDVWIDYLRHTAEREDQLGYGEHLLYIARKKS